MKPHIICHMLSSLDGKTDSDALDPFTPDGEYEATGDTLKGDAWVCGRTTMQQHFAEEGSFQSTTNEPAGPRPVSVARRAESYAVAIDTHGKLLWSGGDLDGDHLICIVSEQTTGDYLDMLQTKGISFIVAGERAVDLPAAVKLLGEHFGIRTLLLEGGGHINGAFLEAGLIDEVSLVLVPAIDGRSGIAASFDGVNEAKKIAAPLALKSVERRPGDALWLRYEVVRTEEEETRWKREH